MGSIFSMSNNGNYDKYLKYNKIIKGTYISDTEQMMSFDSYIVKGLFYDNYVMKINSFPYGFPVTLKNQFEKEGISVRDIFLTYQSPLYSPEKTGIEFNITSEQYNTINLHRGSSNPLKIVGLPGKWSNINIYLGGKKPLKQKKAHRLTRRRSLQRSRT